MKLYSAIALVALTSLALTSKSAQSAPLNSCMTCLQSSLSSLSDCKGLDIQIGNLNPGNNPSAFATCLCSSLDAAWVDACTGAEHCDQDILSFKNTYSENIQAAGLSCQPTPVFLPAKF
ncbi:hypothetical protein BX616_010575 [Lobosporangium transversale]|uniref:Extracellular membrane protein CFEM domain-containing protein n=1 Tax=Lobosporangium transversale TaxID=64571 RepID=A0A1Y2GT74_9FUNG|nr:hypothetical protein BCR41DRAFT_349483 [Lobosporangium transversale]KAF9911474.1 hypothetical protein BX616_010575 [Lobosporangium transversale]ORZ22690.1 hypothetical protein BCR41DRAFT_349483 [Lobosporangium transversale]|eukprot:XP_021883244.1 hypothetical protein BCR41DRAFT_349483 [Lobosporangium transversale]